MTAARPTVTMVASLLIAAASPALAEGQETALSQADLDQLTAEVAAQLRCPVCRNQSVLESSSALAREMQSVIRDRLAAGETPEEVKVYFVGRYGDWILLKPEPRGINLVVYLLPAAALLAGALGLAYRMRRWTAGETEPPLSETRDPVPVSGAMTTIDPPSRQTADGGLSEEEKEWIRKQLGSVG